MKRILVKTLINKKYDEEVIFAMPFCFRYIY